MAGRPRTRTAKLASDRLQLLREVFGSSMHAYRSLGPYMGVSISHAVFRRVWDGKEEGPAVVKGVDQALRTWATRQLDAILAA